MSEISREWESAVKQVRKREKALRKAKMLEAALAEARNIEIDWWEHSDPKAAPARREEERTT